MFKILRFNNCSNPILFKKTLGGIINNPNLYKQFLTINKIEQLPKGENLNKNNTHLTMKISQTQNRNFFKKIFKKKEENLNENNQQAQKSKTEELKLQDINGNINLSQNSKNANDGEYEFSHKTETQNEFDNKEEYDSTNLFSKEDFQIEDIGFKKSITTKNISLENNIHKFAHLINFEMKFVGNNQIAKYNELNFEEDLVNLIEEMKKFGYNHKLIHSIFRKK